MNIEKVCKNVGWDGVSFCCLRCNKAGFTSQAQAVGHQSQCPMNNKNLGALPQQETVVVPASFGTTLPQYSGGGTTEVVVPAELDNKAIARMLIIQSQQIADIKKSMTNEIPHAIAKQQMGFLGISKEGWIIIGVVALVAYSMGHSSSCRCPVSEGAYRRTGGRLSSIQDKVTDKAISYGISRLFK
jgi:hypothetical protein